MLGMMRTRTLCLAPAVAVGTMLLLASSIRSETDSGRWTLAQARTYLATQSPLELVDMTQSDRPEFLVRFTARDGRKLRPLGRARIVHERRTWQRFSFAGRLVDVQRAVPVRVEFVLQAVGGKLTEVHGPPPNRFQPRFPLRTTVYYEWFPE